MAEARGLRAEDSGQCDQKRFGGADAGGRLFFADDVSAVVVQVSGAAEFVENDHAIVLESDADGKCLNNCSVVSRFVCGGPVTISRDGEEPTLHNSFVGEIESSLRTESRDARLRKISTSSRQEFLRVLDCSAMLF